MARLVPPDNATGSNTLKSMKHSKMHRVVSVDEYTPDNTFDIDASGNSTLAGNLYVSGNETINGTQTVKDGAVFESDVLIDGSETISGGLNVIGACHIATKTAGTNNDEAASTAFVVSAIATAIANLINSSPATLDTLNEIATALGNDPAFATTITNLVGTKISKLAPAELSGLTGKDTLTGADVVLGENSANSYSKVKVTMTAIYNFVNTIVQLGNTVTDSNAYANSDDVTTRLKKLMYQITLKVNSSLTTATPTADKIPIADGYGKLNSWLVPYLPEGSLVNGKVTVTVASNNLTVAIKTLAGTDPSSSDPVYIRIGHVVRTLTAALSVTASAGTNWMGLGGTMFATQITDLFVYIGYNATDGITLGFSRIPFATTYGEFSATSTAETYCKISNIAHAASTDPYTVVGRFAASLGASATYYWTDQSTGTRGLIRYPIFETEWRLFVPTLTNVTLGSGGTNVGTYMIRCRQLRIDYAITLGSSGISVGTGVTVSTPFTMANDGWCAALSDAQFYDFSATTKYHGVLLADAPTSFTFYALNASATYTTQAGITSSIPFTWAASDTFRASAYAVI